MAKFYGIYRGTVVSNKDPKQLGRLILQVPQVLGDAKTSWSWNIEPSNAHFEPPVVGQGVWVAFEGGDSSAAVWWGGFGTPKTDKMYAFIKLLERGSYPNSIQTVRTPSGKYQFDVIETIVSLANKVESLESDVSTLQQDVTTLQQDVSNLESDVNTLQSDLQEAESDISSLEGRVTTLEQAT